METPEPSYHEINIAPYNYKDNNDSYEITILAESPDPPSGGDVNEYIFWPILVPARYAAAQLFQDILISYVRQLVGREKKETVFYLVLMSMSKNIMAVIRVQVQDYYVSDVEIVIDNSNTDIHTKFREAGRIIITRGCKRTRLYAHASCGITIT